MKIVVTKKLPYDISKDLPGFRIEINDSEEPLSTIRLRHMLTDANGLLSTLSDNIDRTTIDAAPQLKVIANYAVGFNNIDVEYAKHKGIIVCTTQDILTQSTAELGFTLLLAAARRVIEGDKMVRNNRFFGATPTMLLGTDLYKKTIGIYGMGKIGQAVAKIASGFSMDIIYHNRTKQPHTELLLGATYATFDELLEWSDYLIITAPLTDDTKHRFSLKEFKKMKKNSVLVNIGRGPIIRESDLVIALKEQILFSAGLDVYEFEPNVNEELKSLDNVVLLPHIGSATVATRYSMAKICADSIVSVLTDRVIPNNSINL